MRIAVIGTYVVLGVGCGSGANVEALTGTGGDCHVDASSFAVALADAIEHGDRVEWDALQLARHRPKPIGRYDHDQLQLRYDIWRKSLTPLIGVLRAGPHQVVDARESAACQAGPTWTCFTAGGPTNEPPVKFYVAREGDCLRLGEK